MGRSCTQKDRLNNANNHVFALPGGQWAEHMPQIQQQPRLRPRPDRRHYVRGCRHQHPLCPFLRLLRHRYSLPLPGQPRQAPGRTLSRAAITPQLQRDVLFFRVFKSPAVSKYALYLSYATINLFLFFDDYDFCCCRLIKNSR